MIQLWCSATGRPWTWEWQAYPGAWLFVAALLITYLTIRRRAPGPAEWWRPVLFTLGLIAVWAAIDWPIGALGSGYLLSVHEVQYVLLGLIGPALLLLGLPPHTTASLPAERGAGRVLRTLSRPLPAVVAYHLALLVTHIPFISDALMPSQLGSLAIDLTWLLAGLWFWWPVVAPEGINRVRMPLRIAYLFGSTILPTIPAAFITFARYPLYSLYELAPPIGNIAAKGDQQLAGLIMKLGADPVIWIAMSVVFFRWARADGDR